MFPKAGAKVETLFHSAKSFLLKVFPVSLRLNNQVPTPGRQHHKTFDYRYLLELIACFRNRLPCLPTLPAWPVPFSGCKSRYFFQTTKLISKFIQELLPKSLFIHPLSATAFPVFRAAKIRSFVHKNASLLNYLHKKWKINSIYLIYCSLHYKKNR